MDKISIVVPIYNIEDCLIPCIESIINQTYTNLEIILVDDGSPDNCGEICDEYAKKDNRIKVIHKKNGGLSDARNAGIDAATGEYLGFVDGDDTIEPRMYEELYDNLKKNDAEISLCNFRLVGGREYINNHIGIRDEVLSGKDILFKKRLVLYSFGWAVVWNKLYRREIFQTLRFPVGKVHEDEFVLHKVFWDVKKVACTSHIGYNYIQRNTSISNSYNVGRLDACEAQVERGDFYKDNDVPQYVRYIALARCYYIIYDMYEKSDFRREPIASRLKYLIKELKVRNRELLKEKMSRRQKAILIANYISPYFTWKIKELKKFLKRKK